MVAEARKLGVSTDTGERDRYYTVAITQSAFGSGTGDNNGGGINPKVALDYGTAPTTLVISKRVARGNIRYKKMIQLLSAKGNIEIKNLVTTGDSDGDTQITALAFGVVIENAQFFNVSGSFDDGSTSYSANALSYIKDTIAECLNSTFVENIDVYDPSGSNADGMKILSITAGPVRTNNVGEIAEAIAVAEVTGFRSHDSGGSEIPADKATSSTGN